MLELSHKTGEPPLCAGDCAELYPLSPLQLGMLFHSLDGHSAGVDIEQISCFLDEALDIASLHQAWQQVLTRHAILRTRFSFEQGTVARQAVCAEAPLSFEAFDWRDHTETEQDERWATLQAEERQRGFDLSRLPLMRLKLVAVGAQRFRLLWTFHHILLDGRSFPIVLREVFTAYTALREGQPLALPPPRPYWDFIAWLGQQDIDCAEPYWRGLLSGLRAIPRVHLPCVTAATAGAASPQGVVETRLSHESSAALSAFATAHRVTVNTLLQGAWALLLHHYSGSDDVIFGATRACRHSPLGGAHDMVGLFINTLPMRVRIDSDAPLTQWLLALRDQQVALRGYEHTPLVKVQEWSEILPGSPLFDSILVFENQSLDRMMRSLGGEWQHRSFEYRGQTNYPLTLIAYNDPCLLLRLEYDRSRFDDDAGRRMLNHLRTLFEGMVGAADRRVWQVPLLPKAERQQLTAGFGQLMIRYPEGACLHELFDAQARRTPDNIALAHNGATLNYRELNRRADRLAHRLHRAGVGPEVLVGLCTERSLQLVVGILAILKAGGAYLPLDPSYPQERLHFMLEDAAVKYLLCDQRSLPRCAVNRPLTTLLIDQEDCSDSSASPPEDSPLVGGATPDNLAYVIYTSGSTGKPKGALVTHYNVTRLFQATEAWFHFNASDVWTLFHSYAFDFSVWEIWGALLHGGTLVVVPQEVTRSPEEFAALIKEQNVTVLNQTPSAFRPLIAPMIEQVRLEEMPLRAVIFGGEALEFQSLRPWFDCYGDERPRLINMYGITETTVHVTYRRVVKADLNAGSSSNIGKAIPDLSIHLLDTHRQLVPIGVPGEIYVGGAGVARGYLQRANLTAQRFVTNPFSSDPQAKLYRSGDLARWLANGELEYLGRIDHQVKIRGFRIELGEIESALNQQAGVREAIVIVREDVPGDKRLAAYYVGSEEISSEALRNSLRACLPDHMVPAAFVQLDALPLTANGKLDRKALPAPDPLSAVARENYLSPRSDKEATLWEIWRSVLGISRLGIEDNFFELGGDSILCIQVITRARQAGLGLSTRDLFKHPTIAGLAACSSATPAVAHPAQAKGAVLLTPIQHWFFEQHLAEQHHWNQAFLFETPADMDAELLQAALQRVVTHHDSFRLRFHRTPRGWEQSYGAEVGSIAMVRKDLSELSTAAQETTLTELAESLQPSLDIGAGPVLRAAHVSLGGDCAGRLLIIVHHLVIDGVSWRIFMEDLEAAYRALQATLEPSLPARTSSYQSWSASLNEYAQSEAVRSELDYWRAVVANGTAELPIDLDPKAIDRESSAQTVTMRLNAEETRRLLQQVPKELRAQIDEILLGALATAFSGWVTDDSLLVDLEGHGRDEVVATTDVSRTIGWFTAIAPVRLDLPPGGDLIESLRRAKSALRSRPRHGIGYGALRYLSDDENVRRELAAMPRAPVAFNYLGQVDQWLADSTLFRFAKESSGSWHSAQAQRRYQFEIICAVQNGCFEARWIYSENLHRQETVEALAGKFLGALRQLVERRADAAASVLVPEDFPLVEVDRPWLDRLISQYGAIEDLYPLTPMQKLFHAMDSAQGKLGFEQWHYILKGPLDKAAFKQAWEQVVARHAPLRSAFVSIDLPEPLQLVHPSVSIPWIEEDWRAESPAQQEEKLMALLRADRELGLDLSVAPLLRLSLIRTAEETYYFIWTTHHLLIDGWSWPLVFQELSAAYNALCRGTAADLPYVCKFGDYVDWLRQQSAEGAEKFWRQELSGITRPTRFGLHHPGSPVASDHSAFREESARLSESTMASLQSLARSHKVTLNTLVQAAWGLLLSRRSGEQDVMFGAAFSGRPSELRGIEAMVGACVNNLPVRLRVDREMPLSDFLTAVQERQFAASQHQYCSLEDIQSWSQVPARHRLFESLLVFQNYLVGNGAHCLGDDVAVHALAVPETTNFPITLMVTPARDLRVKILFRPTEYSNENIRRLIGELQLVLEVMSANPHYSVGEVLSQLPHLTPALMPPPQDGRPAGAARLSCDSRLLLSTEMERRIAAIWQSLFEIEEIDLDANFFDLGGHSVLMVQAHKRLRETLGRDVPIVKLFQYPTIRTLAKFLEGEMGESSLHQQAWQRAQKQKLVFGQKPQAMRQPHGRI